MKLSIINFRFILIVLFVIKGISVPLSAQTVTDIDGNVYHTITIGTQIWMVENLKTTKFSNGDAIPNVTNNTTWMNLTAGAYCDYMNNAVNATTYGRLYNWYALNDNRKIAPAGWHVSTDAEWTYLIDYLGGLNVAGGKLKEYGTAHWLSPNTGATNLAGFTALPGGYRDNSGVFRSIGAIGSWWSANQSSTVEAWAYGIFNDNINLDRGNYYIKKIGFSVRCVKDFSSTDIKNGNSVPLHYTLAQNYPNPFNPATKIRFELPKISSVSLKIYNTLGEEIYTLVNEYLAPGIYEKNWNANGLPGGVYLLKFHAGEYNEMKLMILMK